MNKTLFFFHFRHIIIEKEIFKIPIKTHLRTMPKLNNNLNIILDILFIACFNKNKNKNKNIEID
jgi:hypothetical protein